MQEEWRGEIEQLSWKPRAFLVKGFLNDEECDHIVSMVRCRQKEGVQQPAGEVLCCCTPT